MTTRKPLSTKARLKVFTDNGGICCICGGKIDGVREKWIAEHITPLGLLGEDGGDNLKPAHKLCADSKTYGKDGDLATIAKAKRREARHTGARLPKGNIKSPGFPPRQKQAGAASSPIRKSCGFDRFNWSNADE